MRQQRPPSDLMQHLRQRGMHAGAFASGQYDRQTRACACSASIHPRCIPVICPTSGRHSRAALRKKAAGGAAKRPIERGGSESANVFNDLIRAGEIDQWWKSRAARRLRRHGEHFEMRDLSRVAAWGLATLGALTIAAYAASSEIGEDRLILAVANFRGVPPPERLARSPADGLTRQLAVTVRELSAEREQLLARLDTLERNLSDVTGSISRAANQPPAPAPTPTTLPPVVSTPDVVTPASPATADQQSNSSHHAADPDFDRRTRRPESRIRCRSRPRQFGRRPAPALERREEPPRRSARRPAPYRNGARDSPRRRHRVAAGRRAVVQCSGGSANLRPAARFGLSSDRVRRTTARTALTIAA